VPWALVSVARRAPVAMLVAFTLAEGIRLPCSSVTVPLRWVLVLLGHKTLYDARYPEPGIS